MWGTVPCEVLPWERWTRWLCYTEAHVSPCWPAATQIQPVRSCLASSHFWTAQVSCNFPLFIVNKCRGWNAYDCASVQMLFFLLGLIMCFLPSCCLGLSHSTFSIPSPVQFPTAIAMLALLSAASSATVKLLWKQLKILPSDIWVTALWTSWITYACHITGFCCLMLILGCRFSQEQMSFSMVCAALTSPLVPHVYWEADTIFSAGYFANFFWKWFRSSSWQIFCIHFSTSLAFVFSLKPFTCLGRRFFSSPWEGRTPLL